MSGHPHIQQEMALVWFGGSRRYFTRKAALRGAAKAIIRDYFRGSGDDPADTDAITYQAWVTQLVGKIERGERPELDFDEARSKPAPPPFREAPNPYPPTRTPGQQSTGDET